MTTRPAVSGSWIARIPFLLASCLLAVAALIPGVKSMFGLIVLHLGPDGDGGRVVEIDHKQSLQY